MFSIQILSVLGIVLSLYTLYLHWKIAREEEYKAVCDVSDRFSCTKSIRSKEGKILGIPNGVFGVGFYSLILILTFTEYVDYIFLLTIMGLIASLYFAYNLYFKVKTICLVCNSIYVINVLLFVVALLEL